MWNGKLRRNHPPRLASCNNKRSQVKTSKWKVTHSKQPDVMSTHPLQSCVAHARPLEHRLTPKFLRRIERCLNIASCDNEHHRLTWTCCEAESEIELAGVLRDCLNNHASYADGVSGCGDAHGRIAKQSAANPLPLPATIHRQAAEQYDRNRIRHIAAEAPRRQVRGDGRGGQGIIARYPIAIGSDKGAACSTGLIDEGASFQPVIQRLFA